MTFVTAWAGGATDKSVTLTGFTVSTGAVYTAGAYNTAGITAKYRRHGANAEATITLATQTANGAHSDGGFVHVSGGRYRLDLPDAAIASGSDFVDIWVYGITDVYFTDAHVDIMGSDPRGTSVDANVTSISGDTTAADNAEAFFDGTGYAGTNNVIPVVTTATNVTSLNGISSGVITSSSFAAGAINDAAVAADVTIASVTGAVGSVTGNVGGNVTGSVGSVAAGGITAASLAADAITAAKVAADVGTEIAAAVLAAAAADPIDANVEQINAVAVIGIGTAGNKWRAV